MEKRVVKVISVFLIICLGLFAFAGCKDKGIEGTWILKEEYDSDGKKTSSEELKNIGVSEKYEISGTEVKYTCESTLLKKPISITFELEDLGNNMYSFKMPSGFVFATALVKGNTMTYIVGTGESQTKMVFKRQKAQTGPVFGESRKANKTKGVTKTVRPKSEMVLSNFRR